ncbi:hypothetical protein KSP39_PZI017234 [Platanthera zijinensis]|uniref:SprT-like domain-containing protein n=1 Tax=Platanthera zijinensis TaxID=2320716 RepID=A0AAP0FZW5_9ASPA
MAEPGPDIHELFCHYNSLYFNDDLITCFVSWAPCLTSMASSCDCTVEGHCEIQLSVPLLKCRSSADLKNILLHEMIHAFMWIVHKINNHSDHGPIFQNKLKSMNLNRMDDLQRPSNGYNVTSHHGFQNEENASRAHLWMGASCGNLIKRGMNREEPLHSDSVEKKGCDNNCNNHSYEWQGPKKLCSGRYEKVDDISGFKDKGKSIEDFSQLSGVQENAEKKRKGSSQFNRQTRPRLLLPADEIKDKRVSKRPRIMAEYFLSGDDKPKNLGKKSSQPDCSNNNQLTVVDLRTRTLAMGPEIPRQPRTTCRKICSVPYTEESKHNKRPREISLVIQQFGVYTDEESEEDLQPLINKRSERRKKMKMFSNSDRKAELTAGLTPREVISLD